MIGEYKIITLCGSAKFKEEFMEEQKRLTLAGNIVLPLGFFKNEGEGTLLHSDVASQRKTKDMLCDLHKRKIDLSDEVFVINVAGYIGENTRAEIAYALAQGKMVMYLESPGHS